MPNELCAAGGEGGVERAPPAMSALKKKKKKATPEGFTSSWGDLSSGGRAPLSVLAREGKNWGELFKL